MMAAFGVPQEDIGRLIGVTPPTLRLHYFQEIELGALKANAKVATNLFRIACKESREGLDAAKFWLKMRAGWSEASAPLSTSGDIGIKEQRELAAKAPPPDEWDGLVKH